MTHTLFATHTATASGAWLDPTCAYRYLLWRAVPAATGGERVLFVMLNPSTADDFVDDPTIRRCLGFARDMGASVIEVVNLFAYRTTDPKALDRARCKGLDIVGPLNDSVISDAVRRCERIVLAWGAQQPEYRYGDRPANVVRLIRYAGKVCECLALTKAGHPRHPLYLPATAAPMKYDGEANP